MGDNSDWWSTLRDVDSDTQLEPEQREFAKANFQILGVSLGEKMFGNVAEKLGKGTALERGDAASGRSQVCYISSTHDEKTYLVFEEARSSLLSTYSGTDPHGKGVSIVLYGLENDLQQLNNWLGITLRSDAR